MQVIDDLRTEGNALYEVLSTCTQEQWETQTQFKDWTIYDVVLHLHHTDHMAVSTASDKEAFSQELMVLLTGMGEGKGMMEVSREWLPKMEGKALLARWHTLFHKMCDIFASLDPSTRLDWFGPDMGLRSFVTARLMETWAHGQEIYDLLGLERVNTDRIKHVVTIGVKTFKWSFVNRGQTPPEAMPYLKLRAPSGALWEYGEAEAASSITGPAEDFAQVVTQVRHVEDTALVVTGDAATKWMEVAQCFAGPPVTPPAPGTRFRQTKEAS